jgi:hypothetical protein
MPRKRRHAKQRRVEVDAMMREYFEDKIKYVFFFNNFELSDGWNQIGDEIVAAWILTRPGTRPRMWWRLSAPEHGRLSNGGPPGGAPNRLDIQMAAPPPAQQKRFLKRHSLLLPGELERLAETE